MRFLLDQDVYAATARLLQGAGHDIATADELGYSRAPDAELLALSQTEERILVTRDRDFGSLVFLRGSGPGVIYLRIPPFALEACHTELLNVISSYSEYQLQNAFVVVEPGRHRFRRLAV